jgi:asparagine synthetase B (glutamine-hydrolysing)
VDAARRRRVPDAKDGARVAPEGTDALTQALYFEATAKLTGDMLVKVDRMSMANSLEVRCPMLDHELAELAARIPHSWKLKNGRGKDIFIRAVGHRLPPELLRQPKRVRRAAGELAARRAAKLRVGPPDQPGVSGSAWSRPIL